MEGSEVSDVDTGKLAGCRCRLPCTCGAQRAENERLRTTLHLAHRALLHARMRINFPDEIAALIRSASDEVTRVLDEGRDETNEQVAT